MSSAHISTRSLVRTDAGGVLRVGQTRVSLASIVAAFKEGAAAEAIADDYPSLALADVYELIAHYLRHRESLDSALAEEDAMLEQLVAPIKAAHAARNTEFRRRLLERTAR